MFYIETGNPQGQPILFIHGWASDHKSLLHTAETYFSEYRCILIDLPGYGQSEMITYHDSLFEEIARQIAVLIQKLHLSQVILYGNCLGGNVGMFLCLKIPEKLAYFIWIDGFLYFEKKFVPFILPVVGKPLYSLVFQQNLGLKVLNMFMKYAKEIPEEMLNNTQHISPAVSQLYLKDLKKHEKAGFRLEVANITVPSLFVCGEHTFSVIRRSMDYWCMYAQKSENIVIAHGKHLLVAEDGEVLNTEIKKALLRWRVPEMFDPLCSVVSSILFLTFY